MNNGQNIARSRNLEELARAAKQYTLQEILDVTEAVATELEGLTDFTGATSVTGGLSGFVPAPQAGDESKFLRGDGSWASVESGGASVAVFTGATTDNGTSGLVPAPKAGDNGKFLRGDGTWATVESGSSGGGSIDYVIGSNVSTVEGGFWQDTINDKPVLKLRHGDYEYNFKYDDLTYLGGVSAPLATVTPDTYVLGTASVSTEGGVWYEVTDNVPQLKLHAGNFNYGFNYDLITYKGNNANLVAYLPFDISTTADACGNEWTVTGSPAIVNGALDLRGKSYLTNSTIADSIGSQPWTIDFWLSAGTDQHFNICGFYTSENPNYPLYARYCASYLCIYYESTKNSPNGTFPGNTRTHCAVSYDGTMLRLFVNGNKYVEWEKKITLTGDSFVGDSSTYGTIDHFRIWNTALWTTDFTPPTAADYL